MHRRLCVWGKDFIRDRPMLPCDSYVNCGCRSLLDDVDFVGELRAHVADIGIHASAKAVVDFVKKPEVVERYHIRKPITLRTARKWISKLGFTWRRVPKGT